MKIWKSGSISIFLFIVVLTSLCYADDITSIKKGKWNNPEVWSGGTLPTASDNVTISVTDTVTIDTTFADGTTTMECNNLTISGTLRFSQGVPVSIIVYGSVTVNTGAYFRVMTHTLGGNLVHSMTVYGDITNNGVFDMKNGTVNQTMGICATTFLGTANSTITMNGGYTTANNEFGGVTFNKSGNARIILGNDMYLPSGNSAAPTNANPNLYLTRGIVETGPYALIHLWTTSASIFGASDSSYVLGAMGRGMGNSSGASKDFYIGDSGGYRPIKIRSTTAGNGTGNHAIVRAIYGNAKTEASVLSSDIDKVSSVRYYKIEYKAINAGGSAPPWPVMDFDRFSPSYGKYDGVAANNTNVRVAYSVDHRATWTGITQNVPHTTNLDTLPRMIYPDSLLPAYTLDSVAGSAIYVALARAAGTTENSLDYTPDAVSGIDEIPVQHLLAQNYPNPFNPSTIISYRLPVAEYVSLKVFDMLGKEVATIVAGRKTAGEHSEKFELTQGRALPSGVYFYRLVAGTHVEVKKMILAK